MDSQVWTATIPTLPTEQRSLAIQEARPENPRKISREVPSLGFISRTKRQRLHVSVLRHPDLQPNNIFVSNNGGVTSLIVLPTFFAAGIPDSFQNYGDSGSQMFMPPNCTSWARLSRRLRTCASSRDLFGADTYTSIIWA
jgi:hypothetical protein